MNIQVGKTYLTRDGRKAKVVYISDNSAINFPLLVEIGRDLIVYHRHGRYYAVEVDSPNDLVREDVPMRTYYRAALYKRTLTGVFDYYSDIRFYRSKDEPLDWLGPVEVLEWETRELPAIGI